MPVAALRNDAADNLVARCLEVAGAAEGLLADATLRVRERVVSDGKAQPKLLDREQRAAHGLAWLATYVEALRQLAAYAERMQAEDLFGEIEDLIVRIGSAEYFAQILGGIPMSQNEIVRLSDLGLSASGIAARLTPSVEAFVADGNTAAKRARLIELIRELHDPLVGNSGLDDTLESIREEMRKFSASEVIPNAQSWHLSNSYIPLDIISHMAELGVFGLTIPEDYEGMALGKESMCVVSEELSRGYIGVGSLGTRSEIAAELILAGGTEEQKRKWLPKLASGEILPTAVFTEPNTGSDLASLKTRAVRDGDVYKVYGNKTWITHPVRADLMTLLVRTNPKEAGYRGLSMLLAEKPRGTDDNPFPAKGMSGTEIEVLGYRGMKEYEIAFDGFEVKAENLLGGVEGLGFKQLMQTFESARIQTAARAIGVAQSAMEEALNYASQRQQFGEPIINFPRVADKIALMAVEIMIARQLTYFAARQKDSGRRCDLEAGMAKLLAARVAWSSADNAVQIHGGNGFALEFPISRILCDARILNIFEGAAEIQAQVIARRLLDGSN
jgi:(2S)-methylsuccinyl-CoA dehydrogenase